MTNWSNSISNLPLQPVIILYFHYYNVYGHQTWQVGDLWSFEITWQAKNFIFLLPDCLWSPNLTRFWLTVMESCPWRCIIIWSRGFGRVRDKPKSLYLHYESLYGHLTWENGNLSWETSAYKVKWRFVHVLLRHHVTSQRRYISTTTVSMVTNFGKNVSHLPGLLPIKSLDTSITWSCEVMWQTKAIISPLSQCLWPLNLPGYWLTLCGSHS